MKLFEILKHDDLLKFSKEAKIALANGQIQINGEVVKDNVDLEIEDFIIPESEFFYSYFSDSEKTLLSSEELWAFRFLYDIPGMFDTIEPWPDIAYKRFKSIIDFLSGFIHLRVSKSKNFILMRT